MRVLVTGANGTLGRALLTHLSRQGVETVGACRGPVKTPAPSEPVFSVGELNAQTSWSQVLQGVSHIVHCASLTRVPLDASDATARYRVANVDATARLAVSARAAGVQRLVYISSMTVLGQHSGARLFRSDDAPAPSSPYAQSKLGAERLLLDVSLNGGPEVVIVRPPRIIWPVLTGNLGRLERLVAKGFPMPFGAVTANCRDNLSAHNLLSLISACLRPSQASGRVFLAADSDPMSTRELVIRLAMRCGVRARLLPVPAPLLRGVVALLPTSLIGGLSRHELADELLGNLKIDVSLARNLLGWQPQGRTLLAES